MATGNIVKLNVGGVVFPTRRSTLTKFDGFFKAMFDSGIPLETDEAGYVFIDRDPKQFSFVLNYMRDGAVDLPTTQLEVSQLLREAQYYSLDGLIHLCGGEPSEEWMNANFPKPPIRITAESKEARNFREASRKDDDDKPGLVVEFEGAVFGDISNYQTVLDFFEKHRDKWDILFYNRKYCKMSLRCFFSMGGDDVSMFRYRGDPTDLNVFFEKLEKHIAEEY